MTIKDTLTEIWTDIDKFDNECNESEHTDVGDTWDLLNLIKEKCEHELNPSDDKLVHTATELEVNAIRRTMLLKYPDERTRLFGLMTNDLMIRENYISDGPGFAGTLAVYFWGEPQFITVIGDNGSTGTNWEVINLEV